MNSDPPGASIPTEAASNSINQASLPSKIAVQNSQASLASANQSEANTQRPQSLPSKVAVRVAMNALARQQGRSQNSAAKSAFTSKGGNQSESQRLPGSLPSKIAVNKQGPTNSAAAASNASGLSTA